MAPFHVVKVKILQVEIKAGAKVILKDLQKKVNDLQEYTKYIYTLTPHCCIFIFVWFSVWCHDSGAAAVVVVALLGCSGSEPSTHKSCLQTTHTLLLNRVPHNANYSQLKPYALCQRDIECNFAKLLGHPYTAEEYI